VRAVPAETLDAICGGAVRIWQPVRGYRFSLDSVLLAHFAAAGRRAEGPVADLGTGGGIIPLLLARKFGWDRLFGLELQPALFRIAGRNVGLNGCEDRVSLVLGDLRRVETLLPRAGFAQVLANPPYFRAADARLSPDPQRAVARHELSCRLEDVVRAARFLLRDRGLFHTVFPAGRLDELLAALREAGLGPRRLRTVHPRTGAPARLCLVTALRNGKGGELEVHSPLVLHPGDGPGFLPEVQAMLDE
jgi:tRNA1Val (adenine37-N6)-methyltransferase